jgi:hypothetical protein
MIEADFEVEYLDNTIEYVEVKAPPTCTPAWKKNWRVLENLLSHIETCQRTAMTRCPWCLRGSLRIIAAITHGEMIRNILRHLKLAADPPPIAPARVRQDAFAWSSA